MGEPPHTVGLLGGGVIGGGWAARFLLTGVDVKLYDPAPDAAATVERMIAAARRAVGRLTLMPLPPEGTLSVLDTPEEAVNGVAFVQESAPERLELKRDLLAAASRAAAPEVVFCSSTSGLRPTELAIGMEHPERFAVGHPFNPVYLLPLVEVCGGERTAPATLDRAAEVYRAVGMHPLLVRREIDGFLADRLLEALWREALWLVHDDVATVAELDDAIRFGAGLRWAIMGTFLTYRLAGGEAGMRHFIAQFGPALELPWTRLTDVPELTDAFVEKLAMQSDEQAGGRSIAELERERDDSLVAILQALRGTGQGAGATVAAWERTLMSGRGRAGASALAANGRPTAPLSLYAREIPSDWLDYNGHVTESRYLQILGDATDAVLAYAGMDAGYIEERGSYYTVESHISHLGQLFAGDRVRVASQLVSWDEKRLHLFHTVLRDGSPDPVATGEHMLLHVAAGDGRVVAVGDPLRAGLARVAEAHAEMPWPERAGRRIAGAAGG